MANNYLEFSVSLSLSEKAVNWAGNYFNSEEFYKESIQNGSDEDFWDILEQISSKKYTPSFTIYPEKNNNEYRLYIYSDDYGDVNAATFFIHKILNKFDIDDIISFDYAETCSIPRPNEFNGGHFIISKEKIVRFEYCEWYQRVFQEIMLERPARKNS